MVFYQNWQNHGNFMGLVAKIECQNDLRLTFKVPEGVLKLNQPVLKGKMYLKALHGTTFYSSRFTLFENVFKSVAWNHFLL